MKSIILLPILVLASLIMGHRSIHEFKPIEEGTTPILCGKFTTQDSSAIISSLALREWNTAAFATPFDDFVSMSEVGPAANKTVRPDSRYFISGDTLYLETDKGYLLFRVKDEDTLEGLGMWIEGTTLKRELGSQNACTATHTLSAEDETWLRQSRAYYQVYHATDFEKAITIAEPLCEEGYGPACMTLGLISFLADKQEGLALLEKACEIGYFGNYACFRLAEVLERLENEEAAKLAYQQACEGGHAVGCMMVAMIEDEEE